MRYVALLRAINVGGHTVKMDQLKAIFAELGFTDVETVIASGNVIFSTRAGKPEALEARIETALERALGYEVITFLRQRDALQSVVAFDPFPLMAPAEDDHVLSVAFLKEAPAREAERTLLALRNIVDDFVIRGREVYWLRRTRRLESQVAGPRFEKALRLPATARNITTVRKLALKA